MIFCFSGTGNSRYIAERLADALPDSLVNLNTKIKAQDVKTVQTGQNVILVVPTYAWRIPRIVSEWMYKTELDGAARIWGVMTCGSEIGDAAKYNRQLAEKKHLQYMGTKQIVMPENYIAMFGAPEDAEAREIVKRAEPDIAEVIRCVKEGQCFPAPRNNLYDRVMSAVVNPIFYPIFAKANAFQTSTSCTGCGECVRRCPMNNIELKGGKPVWGSNCTHCMACICYCPAEAIEYGKKSAGKPRYHFERLGIRETTK